MRQDRRGSWYLLTGIVLGVAVGLIYSWLFSPVKYVDAPPYSLRADYKDEYRALIASAYLYSNDLLRASARLAQLKDDNPVSALTLQSQRALAEGHSNEEIQALRLLAQDLASHTPQGEASLIPTPLSTPVLIIDLQTATPLMARPTTIQTVASPITPSP